MDITDDPEYFSQKEIDRLNPFFHINRNYKLEMMLIADGIISISI